MSHRLHQDIHGPLTTAFVEKVIETENQTPRRIRDARNKHVEKPKHTHMERTGSTRTKANIKRGTRKSTSKETIKSKVIKGTARNSTHDWSKGNNLKEE